MSPQDVESVNMRKFIVAALFATSSFAISTAFGDIATASAQEDPRYSGTISTVKVEGNQRIEARTVQSYLLLQPGDRFDAERIDLSLKTLFATGLFADVTIDRSQNDLIVRVVENPIINRVIFEGNRALDDDKLKEDIQAEPRGIFTAARVQQDVQRILEQYRQSGRFAVNVEPQYKPLEQNRVDLIFEISEGPVTGVRAINFIGNDAYSDSRLRSEVVTRQSRLWRFFSSNDNYDPGRLEFDRELLRQFYQNKGYYDFRVTSAVAELTPDQQDFYITFTIDEGRQYDFGEVKVETALEKLDGKALRRAVRFKDGDLYRGDQIEQAIDSITFASGIAGYAFVDIIPQLDVNPETGKVDVTFLVDEGPRVYVERINIVGNTQTLDRVIRRELRISEGDAFNRILLDRSRNRVRRLGYFADVEISERAGSEVDKTIVDIEVEEQPTGEFSFAAGYSSVDSFLLDVSVSQRNLRGRGQSAVARVSVSDRRQIVDLRLTEPKFLDRDLVAGLDLFATRTDFLGNFLGGFESETIGGGLRVGFPLTDRMQFGLNYRLQTDKVNVQDFDILIDENGFIPTRVISEPAFDANGVQAVDAAGELIFIDRAPTLEEALATESVVDVCDPEFISRQSICRSERNELSSILGYNFFWDRRNDPIRPTRGFDLALNQDIAGLGGDVQFLRSQGTANFYRGVWRDVVASAKFTGGYVFPLEKSQGVRINNRFFRGGSTFRGFDVAGLGPREITEVVTAGLDGVFGTDDDGLNTIRGNALGGNAFVQGTFELSVPNFLPEEYGIKSALFADVGAVGLLEDADIDAPRAGIDSTSGSPFVQSTVDDFSLRASVGLSVFWNSPFGPIRFDFAEILKQEEFDRTESFRFSTSTAF